MIPCIDICNPQCAIRMGLGIGDWVLVDWGLGIGFEIVNN